MKIFLNRISLLVCLLMMAAAALAQAPSAAGPQKPAMAQAKLKQIDALVEADIAAKKLPGAVVLIGHQGKIVYRKAYGDRSLVPTAEPMTPETVFDVASLTKPVATATSIMTLAEQGKLRLNDTIGKFISDIDDAEAKKVTIQQLLTHTSGYRPDFDLGEKWTGREGMLNALKKERLRAAPGTKFVYSDIGFIVLGEIIERVSGKPVDVFSKEWMNALKMDNSGFFRVRPASTQNVAPTENVRGQNSYLGSKFEGPGGEEILRGQVHDPTAFRMSGVAGHAGLFSNADDLARYCQMILNGGSADGKEILSPSTVARMTTPFVVSESGDTRGLGWDMRTAFSSNRGEFFPLGSFGHTGFTGTSIWIDRLSQTFVIFLSNRVHPDGKGDVTALRARIATIAAAALISSPLDLFRSAESVYASQVASQIPAFIENKHAAERSKQIADPKNATVLNGIDVLEKDGFKQLEGKRIGLVTNHTGRNLTGRSTIDVLFEAKNLKLVALFAPEHGIRGELDTEKIDDSKDEKTGLPVYSLYKDGMRRPKPEQLKDLDAIVYDIQDIGARFYTYTATLKNVMEEAAKLDLPIYALDRPNPINGVTVEGPLADEDKLAFIAAHTIPVRYGLTIGELGRMMNAERKINAKLTVIEMENWSRSMWFDEAGQSWTNPSPNMRSLTQATLYPGIGLLETTNVSVGRGTDTPFEVVGAPWINGREIAQYLNGRGLKGVRFVPISFKPNASVFKDELLQGINIIITDRSAFDSVDAGIEIACALKKLYPKAWQTERYGRLLVNGKVLTMVQQGSTPAEIKAAWQQGLAAFEQRRREFLLYK